MNTRALAMLDTARSAGTARLAHFVRLDMGAEGTERIPPKEFRLFPAGPFETTKGQFMFDTNDAVRVMAGVAAYRNSYALDYGHSMLDPAPRDPAESGKAAGWFTPALRNGELWATDVQWTDRAAGYLRAGEYRYISPAFGHDEDGHITDLVNCAITNIPATFDLTALVPADKRTGPATPSTLAEKPVSILSGPVPYHPYPTDDSTTWDAAAAVKRLRAWAGVDATDPKPEAWTKYAQGFGYATGDGDKLGDFALPHHDVVDGKLVTSRAGVIAAMASLLGSRGGVDIPDAGRRKVYNHLAQHYKALGLTPPPFHTPTARAALDRVPCYYGLVEKRADLAAALRVIFGLPTLAGDAEINAALSALEKLCASADPTARTGVPVDDILGALRMALTLPTLTSAADVLKAVRAGLASLPA